MLYKELRKKMKADKITVAEIAAVLERSAPYVSERLNDPEKTFSVKECYTIMEYLCLPEKEIYFYFPPCGKEVEKIKEVGADEIVFSRETMRGISSFFKAIEGCV